MIQDDRHGPCSLDEQHLLQAAVTPRTLNELHLELADWRELHRLLCLAEADVLAVAHGREDESESPLGAESNAREQIVRARRWVGQVHDHFAYEKNADDSQPS